MDIIIGTDLYLHTADFVLSKEIVPAGQVYSASDIVTKRLRGEINIS